MLFFGRRKAKPVKTESEYAALIRLGNEFNAERKWREAAIEYSKALKLQPHDVAIRIQLGHSLKEQGQLHEAEAAYRQATLDDALDADAHLHLGHVLKMQRNIAGAVAAYDRAAHLGGTGPVGLDADRELRSLGHPVPEKVVIDLTNVPADGSSELLHALRHQRWTSALRMLDGLEPANPQLVFTRAQIYQIAGRRDEAMALFSKLAASDPGGHGMNALVALYFEMGRTEEALDLLKNKLTSASARGESFEAQIAIAREMIAHGGFEKVVAGSQALFGGKTTKLQSGQRTAVDVKRERAISLLPASTAQRFRQAFVKRSEDFKQVGEGPQAKLLLDEAQALA